MSIHNNSNNSIEEGIINTTDDHSNLQKDVTAASSTSSSSWMGRTRYAKGFVSVAVMVVAIVAVAIIALSTGKKEDVKEVSSSLIVSGTEAIQDSFPYMVFFLHPNWACDGSLIAKDVVLTAAHCANAVDNNTSVILGRHDPINDNDGEVFNVMRKVSHPDWNAETIDADFMLVFLDHAYTASNVDLVTLNSDTSFPCVGQEMTAMGWGATSFRGNASDMLLQVDLNVISDEECALTEPQVIEGELMSYHDSVTQYVLCARGVNGKDTCTGDSGGPLVVAGSNIQVGVVSWGMGCGIEGVPGIYSQVSSAYGWIQEEVCKGSLYASEAGFDCTFVSTIPSSSSVPTYSPTVIFDEAGTQWVDNTPVITKFPTYAPTDGSTSTVGSPAVRACLTQQECYNRYQDLDYDNYYVGNFGDNYGCFKKGRNVFWDEGGTEEQLWDYDFTGEKQSLLCLCVEADC